jgi:hypothetical protein
MRRYLRLLLIACGVALAPALWPGTAEARSWRHRHYWYGPRVYGAAYAPGGLYRYRPFGYGYGFPGYRGYGWGRPYPTWGGYSFGMPGYAFGGYPRFGYGYGYGYGGMPLTNGFYATSMVLPY